jgi:hypothetical protein
MAIGHPSTPLNGTFAHRPALRPAPTHVKIDATAPTVSTSGGGSTNTATPVTLAFTVSDATSRVAVVLSEIDHKPWKLVAADGRLTLTGPGGLDAVSYFARDNAWVCPVSAVYAPPGATLLKQRGGAEFSNSPAEVSALAGPFRRLVTLGAPASPRTDSVRHRHPEKVSDAWQPDLRRPGRAKGRRIRRQ